MVTCCYINLTCCFYNVKLWSLIWVIRSYILILWSLFVTYGHFSVSRIKYFFKSEERVEEKEITSITMNCKPSSSKTISLLTRKQNKRHDEEMDEVKEKLIRKN